MKSEQLKQVREACKERLLDTLMTLVRENGVDYNDYFRDEHGIEADEGYTIGKCFDIAINVLKYMLVVIKNIQNIKSKDHYIYQKFRNIMKNILKVS